MSVDFHNATKYAAGLIAVGANTGASYLGTIGKGKWGAALAFIGDLGTHTAQKWTAGESVRPSFNDLARPLFAVSSGVGAHKIHTTFNTDANASSFKKIFEFNDKFVAKHISGVASAVSGLFSTAAIKSEAGNSVLYSVLSYFCSGVSSVTSSVVHAFDAPPAESDYKTPVLQVGVIGATSTLGYYAISKGYESFDKNASWTDQAKSIATIAAGVLIGGAGIGAAYKM